MLSLLRIAFTALSPRFPGAPSVRLPKKILFFASVFTLLLVTPKGLVADHDSNPNIILILADDMGYGDVQALNPESSIATPNLNTIAKSGMTFTDAHSPSAVCTPTRYAILTGRYCWRSPLKRGVLNGYSAPLIESHRPTIASVLKTKGYVTGIVGKWHLGLGFVRSQPDAPIDFAQQVTHGPNNLGFDYSYIIPASLDFPPYVYLENGKVTAATTTLQAAQKFPAFLRKGPRSTELIMQDCLDQLTERAVTFIQDQATIRKPFFLYFPLTAPHKPVLPHPRFQGKTQLGPYGDFVVQVDDTVGRVMKALKKSNIAQNTLVIYSSDNGSFMARRDARPDHVESSSVQAYRPNHHTANGVLRGTKADIWEAGHRVPFFACWPGKIARATRCDQTICLVDLLATFAEISAAVQPTMAQDSYSLLPLLRGDPSHQRPPIINHSAAGMFAIRDGNWKLVMGNGSGGRERPAGKSFKRPFQLFNLSNDLTESKNVLEQHPTIASRLEQQCLEIIGNDR